MSAWSSPGVASRRDQIGEGRTALANYLTPAFALLYGTFLLGEALTFAAIVGLVLIVAGAEITPYERPVPGARRRDKSPSQGSSSVSLGLGARKVPPFHAASYLSCPAGRSSLVNPARVRPAYRR